MPIQVFLVDDSPVALIVLKRILASSREVEVVGTARSAKEALALIPTVKPDVICTDFHMPQMNGLEFTQEIMANYPRPILVISTAVQPEDTYNVFQLLNAGAVDVFPKPKNGVLLENSQLAEDLIRKIKILSGVRVFTRRKRSSESHHRSHILGKFTSPFTPVSPSKLASKPVRMVGIGASTGGPQALHTILTQLPANLSVPVICIQHISEGFLQGLVNWLNVQCSLSVQIARNGEIPQNGTVYFAPECYHLEMDRQGRFLYTNAPPLAGHRPSITVTFQSLARYYGDRSVGILLTGMGRDGAEGMAAIAESGGMTIAQDEASSVVFGMPKEAIALQAAQQVLSIDAIAPQLLKHIARAGRTS
ncbi:chemotaxis-specific protein-glutamate methyltransferase CheB [Capilliphycus salinus ALCB114379]|uniref:chemotaxis-specific protein-glutamate methyltransferase CheB n=1 Tax=Capilliphycus salinus TaxID=2768948 RepID=UPI0039A602BA